MSMEAENRAVVRALARKPILWRSEDYLKLQPIQKPLDFRVCRDAD